VTSGPLTAPASTAVGGNGVVHYSGLGFPTNTWENANYLADVLFTPTAPYLTLSFNPANPSIASNASAGTVVTTVTATWSDGSPFTGTLSFAQPYSNDQGVFAISGNNLIINPVRAGSVRRREYCTGRDYRRHSMRVIAPVGKPGQLKRVFQP
jgi:hypothetical protein